MVKGRRLMSDTSGTMSASSLSGRRNPGAQTEGANEASKARPVSQGRTVPEADELGRERRESAGRVTIRGHVERGRAKRLP